jgi:hypothetical protein
VDDLMTRGAPLNRPVHVFNVDIKDNHEEALVGGRAILELADALNALASEERDEWLRRSGGGGGGCFGELAGEVADAAGAVDSCMVLSWAGPFTGSLSVACNMRFGIGLLLARSLVLS